MDANDGEHFAPSGATVFDSFRAIDISIIQSKDRCDRFNGFLKKVSYPRRNASGLTRFPILDISQV